MCNPTHLLMPAM